MQLTETTSLVLFAHTWKPRTILAIQGRKLRKDSHHSVEAALPSALLLNCYPYHPRHHLFGCTNDSEEDREEKKPIELESRVPTAMSL
jgi:hypothetical protein